MTRVCDNPDFRRLWNGVPGNKRAQHHAAGHAGRSGSTLAGVTLLCIRGVSVEFRGVLALDNIDLELDPGGVTGLIGLNGAGKTTFIDAVTGMVQSSGQVLFRGFDISRDAPHRRVEKVWFGPFKRWSCLKISPLSKTCWPPPNAPHGGSS